MRLNLSGNQPIITPRDPLVPMEAANKNYVDNLLSAHESNVSVHITAEQNTFLDGLTVTSTEVNQLTGVTSNVQSQLDSKVAKAGDVMTGFLTLSANPTANLHAATKQYVDTQDALKVSKSGDSMSGALSLSGDPTSSLHATPKQYVDASIATHANDTSLHVTTSQNTFLDGLTVTSTEVNQLSGISSNVQTQLDSKLSKSGGTMTGDLTLNANPTANLQAATKQYVDTQDALKVAKSGDTMTGALVLSGDPTANLQASTKQYVDNNLSAHSTDESLHLTSGQNAFLDAVTVTATEVNHLAGVTSDVQTQLNSKLNLAGGTMTGGLTLSADPTTALQAATKQYADTQDALKVAKAGDTMTGALVLSGDPTANLQAAPKQYVDSTVATHTSNEAIHLTSGQNALLDAITVSATEINHLTGVTGDVQTQLGTKFDKAGGTITGDVTISGDHAVFVSKVPTSATELVNKAYVDSIASGLEWKNPVTDINLVADDLNTPPVSPVANDVYIVSATPTGAWAGLAGQAVYHNGTAWVSLQGRAIAAGDRFGVKLTSATAVSAGLTAYAGNLVTVVSATPGSVTYSVDSRTPGSTSLVFDPQSSKFGVSYTYTDEGTWVPTNTSVNIVAGDGIDLNGNTLNVMAGNGIVVTDTVAVKLSSTSGLKIDGTTALAVKYAAADLVVDGSGDLALSTAVHSDIADRLSKANGGTVEGVVVFSAASELNLSFTATEATHAVTKAYVDGLNTTATTNITTLRSDVDGLLLDPVTLTYVDSQDALKVAKAGDTMTGALILSADPTVALQAATKQYVDTNLSTHTSNEAIHLTSGQNALLDAVTVSATEINRLAGVTSDVQTQLNSKLNLAGGTMTGELVLSANPVNALDASTKQYTDAQDALKVAKAGDTMTGALVLSGDPTANLQAATKQYVDTNLSNHATDNTRHLTSAQNTLLDNLTATYTELNQSIGVTSNIQTQLNSKLNLAGGTMTGALTLDADPIDTFQAATKQYVDNHDALKVAKAGDTMTGALTLSGAPTANLHAVTKQYSDDNLSAHANNDSIHITSTQNTFLDGITVDSTEVNQLEGVTSNVQSQLDSKLNLAGGTMTGTLTLNANPTNGLEAATKQYTDTQDALKVAKAGDTMTGALVLSGNPTANLQAAPKQYVDSVDTANRTYTDTQDALKVAKAGDTMTGALILSADPTVALQAATKQYVDTKDADRKTYVDNQDAGLQSQIDVISSVVDTLNSDPVTKAYVDSQDFTKFDKAGGAVTGYITLHADPQQSMHPATKQYVDGIAQGLLTRPGVRLATTANLDATYNNGTFGVNATLTGNANGALVVDGKAAILGDRILARLQTNKVQNGDYVVQQVGNASTPFILKRVNTVDESQEIPSSFFYVADGDTLEGTGWTLVVNDPVTFAIGTDEIAVNQFSGQGNIISGAGLTLNGNTIDINTASPARIVVNADNIDLATTGVSPNTYTKVTVDGYGRVTAASNPTTLAGYSISDGQPLNANLTSLSGVSTNGLLVRDNTNTLVTKAVAVAGTGLSIANGDGASAGNITITSNATNLNTAGTMVARDGSGNFVANIITASLNGNALTSTTLETARDFSITGDVVASAVSFNGSANVSLTTALTTTGVTAGQYTRVTVDAKGRVTLGDNPDTVAGMGLIDAATIDYVNTKVAELENKFSELYLFVLSKL